MKPTQFRRHAGAALALTLAASLSTGTAFATQVAPPDTNPSEIDANKGGSITIFKHEDKKGGVGDPTKASDPLTSNPVEGVEFTAFRLDAGTTPLGTSINIATDNDVWVQLNDLAKSPNFGALCNGKDADAIKANIKAAIGDKLGVADEVKVAPATNSEGMSKLSDLAVGAYLLCETKAPTTVVGKAAPTLVTIPYPDTTRDGKTNTWVYDVTIFPKNTLQSINKTIEQQKPHGFGIGSEVHFPVTASIPTLPEGEHFKYFFVSDDMDTRFTDLGVAKVTYGANGTGADLTEGADYNVSIDGQKVVVSLTEAGLQKLEAAQGQTLQVIFKGKVNELGTGETAGKINNVAKVTVDLGKTPEIPPTEPPGGQETPEVKTWWGDARIFKFTKENNANVALSGVTFQVFEAKTPYPENGTCSTEKAEGAKAIEVNGKTELVSDKDGLVKIDGLFVSSSYENDKPDNEFRCYVLEETAVPAGYVLPTGGKELSALKINVGQTSELDYDLQIENKKQDIPDLPLTGANGQMLLLVGGGALVLLGAGTYMVRRSRKQEA
ncbi:MAG: SpaH/EbpB family LPXTG-anchored major pilin [Actinomycetaceae bacterium]|nr:SpaH/EbpB family LPXTG-anchored major pilin [Actinomycetaceae bacterium]